MSKQRAVCFTLFNYGIIEDYVKEFGDRFTASGRVRYCIFQEEKCPDTDRTHLQGYIHFENSWSHKRICTFIGDGVHIERRRGSIKQAADYCRKPESRISGPYEYGEIPSGSGSRSDLERIREEIEAGTGELEIAQAYFSRWVVYRKSFSAYRDLLVRPRKEKTKVAILWGAAGSGKTRAVYDLFGHDEIYDVPNPNGGSVWFDGYKQQKCILLDDFYGWIKFTTVLKLGDRYPLQLPKKGGFVEFNSKYMVITSNKPWSEWYNEDKVNGELLNAFRRRLDLVIEYDSAGPIRRGFGNAELAEITLSDLLN